MDIAITTRIEAEDIMEALTDHNQLNQDELFEFIRDLDLMVADWDFTLRLRDHFIKECYSYETDTP